MEETCRIIEQALRQSEIRYEKTGNGLYRVLFQGNAVKDLILCLRVDHQWIQILSLFGRRFRAHNERLLQWLLEQNHTTAAVKFALNPAGDILIQAEMPTDSLDLRGLQTLLQAVVTASDTLYQEYLAVSS